MRGNTEEEHGTHVGHGGHGDFEGFGGRGAWAGHGHGHEQGGHLGPFGRGRSRWGGHRGGHHGGHHGGQDWQDFFGGEGGFDWRGPFGGFGGPGGPGGPGGFRGGRERMERGMLRYIILSVLKDGPRHGYDIIKQMEERTQGRYSPSPGTLYPTLQYMEDLGLVRSEQEADRRVYRLTESGHAELDKQHEMVEGFWSRFGDRGSSGPHMHELKFAGDALKDLLRTLAGGLRSGIFTDDASTVRRVREALERCQNEIREIISQAAASGSGSEREAGSHASHEAPGEEYV